MAEKAPYKLAIRMTSARPEAVGDALKRLREIASDYDQTGEATATLTFEAFKEAPLREIREMFEVWLHHYQIGIECEVTQKAPGLRPETVTALRATRTTPMDRNGWEDLEAAAGRHERELDEAEEEASLAAEERGPIIIAPPLALPPPGDVPVLTIDDGSFTLDEAEDA